MEPTADGRDKTGTSALGPLLVHPFRHVFAADEPCTTEPDRRIPCLRFERQLADLGLYGPDARLSCPLAARTGRTPVPRWPSPQPLTAPIEPLFFARFPCYTARLRMVLCAIRITIPRSSCSPAHFEQEETETTENEPLLRFLCFLLFNDFDSFGCGRRPAPFNRDPTGIAGSGIGRRSRPAPPRWVAVKLYTRLCHPEPRGGIAPALSRWREPLPELDCAGLKCGGPREYASPPCPGSLAVWRKVRYVPSPGGDCRPVSEAWYDRLRGSGCASGPHGR